MKSIINVLIISLSLMFSSTLVAQDKYDMPNATTPFENVIAGGQPSIADIERFKADGVKMIVNLRSAREHDQSEIKAAALVAGIRYVDLPVSGRAGVSITNAKKLDAVLASLGQGKAVVHCASSNRVGALLAIRASHLQGITNEEAIMIGRKAGLKSLESTVKAILEQE